MRVYERFFEIVKQLFESEMDFEGVNADITKEDIKELIDIAINHKMLYIVYQVLIHKFPDDKYLKILNQKHKKYLDHTIEAIKTVVNILNDIGCPYCIIKGMPLSLLIYEDPYIRYSRDIDIIMNEEQWKDIYLRLRKFGYSQVNNENEDELSLYFSDAYFEVKLVNKEVQDYPAIELKCGSSAFGRQEIGWLDNTEIIELAGCQIKAQSREYALIHMFANTFTDNEDRVLDKGNLMRNYFDLAYYLEYCFDGDFEKIITIASKLKCSRKIYRVLNSLNQIFDFKMFKIEKAIETSRNEALLYPQIMPAFSQNDDFMGGSRVPNNVVWSNAILRLMNRDMAFCEYVKNHKASVFSKINPYYINRTILAINESTDWIKYDAMDGVHYRYCNTDTNAIIECKVESSKNDELKDRYKIKFILINSNYFVPTLYEDIHVMMCAAEFNNQKIVFNEGDYTTEFMEKHKDLFIKSVAYVSMCKKNNYNIYTFNIKKHSVLLEHNTLLFEFSLSKVLPNGFDTNMASRQEIVEFNQ